MRPKIKVLPWQHLNVSHFVPHLLYITGLNIITPIFLEIFSILGFVTVIIA